MKLRIRVLNLYKDMLHTAKSYPGKSYEEVRTSIYNAFSKNKTLSTTIEIEEGIKKGEFIIKEIETLVYLKKYRAMKKRYYDEN
eukprot:gene11056-3764_t